MSAKFDTLIPEMGSLLISQAEQASALGPRQRDKILYDYLGVHRTSFFRPGKWQVWQLKQPYIAIGMTEEGFPALQVNAFRVERQHYNVLGVYSNGEKKQDQEAVYWQAINTVVTEFGGCLELGLPIQAKEESASALPSPSPSSSPSQLKQESMSALPSPSPSSPSSQPCSLPSHVSSGVLDHCANYLTDDAVFFGKTEEGSLVFINKFKAAKEGTLIFRNKNHQVEIKSGEESGSSYVAYRKKTTASSCVIFEEISVRGEDVDEVSRNLEEDYQTIVALSLSICSFGAARRPAMLRAMRMHIDTDQSFSGQEVGQWRMIRGEDSGQNSKLIERSCKSSELADYLKDATNGMEKGVWFSLLESFLVLGRAELTNNPAMATEKFHIERAVDDGVLLVYPKDSHGAVNRQAGSILVTDPRYETAINEIHTRFMEYKQQPAPSQLAPQQSASSSYSSTFCFLGAPQQNASQSSPQLQEPENFKHGF